MNDFLKQVLTDLITKLEENKETISRLQVENTNIIKSIEELKTVH